MEDAREALLETLSSQLESYHVVRRENLSCCEAGLLRFADSLFSSKETNWEMPQFNGKQLRFA